MLASIEPSRDITGGIWYEGTELNSDLISSLQTEAYNFISAKVSYLSLIIRNFHLLLLFWIILE